MTGLRRHGSRQHRTLARPVTEGSTRRTDTHRRARSQVCERPRDADGGLLI